MDEFDMLTEYYKTPLETWRAASVPYWEEARIYLGRLQDGRWYASGTGRSPGAGKAYASTDEHEVRTLATDWLDDGRAWVPTPASYDGWA